MFKTMRSWSEHKALVGECGKQRIEGKFDQIPVSASVALESNKTKHELELKLLQFCKRVLGAQVCYSHA
jgi:hypothetical protein